MGLTQNRVDLTNNNNLENLDNLTKFIRQYCKPHFDDRGSCRGCPTEDDCTIIFADELPRDLPLDMSDATYHKRLQTLCELIQLHNPMDYWKAIETLFGDGDKQVD